MYKIVYEAHSGWAYIALLALLVAVVNALAGFFQKKTFTPKDKRLSLFALIGAHVQFVLGMLLYFVSPNGLDKIKAVGMSGLTAYDRLLAVEHPFVNLLAVVLITIGWSKHKRMGDDRKFKSISVFYTIGLVLLLSRIPWANWLS